MSSARSGVDEVLLAAIADITVPPGELLIGTGKYEAWALTSLKRWLEHGGISLSEKANMDACDKCGRTNTQYNVLGCGAQDCPKDQERFDKSQEGSCYDPDEVRPADYYDRLAEPSRVTNTRNERDDVALEFWRKHALGSMLRPSCLVCGRNDYAWPPGIQHAELPSIVVCHPCRDARSSTSQPPRVTIKDCADYWLMIDTAKGQYFWQRKQQLKGADPLSEYEEQIILLCESFARSASSSVPDDQKDARLRADRPKPGKGTNCIPGAWACQFPECGCPATFNRSRA